MCNPDSITVDGVIRGCSQVVGSECPVTSDQLQIVFILGHRIYDLVAMTPFVVKVATYLVVVTLVLFYESLEILCEARFDGRISFPKVRRMIYYGIILIQVNESSSFLFLF